MPQKRITSPTALLSMRCSWDPTNVDNKFVWSLAKDHNPLELAGKSMSLNIRILAIVDKANAGNKTASRHGFKTSKVPEHWAVSETNLKKILIEQVTPSMWHDTSGQTEAIADLPLWQQIKGSSCFQPTLGTLNLSAISSGRYVGSEPAIRKLYNMCFVENSSATKNFVKL